MGVKLEFLTCKFAVFLPEERAFVERTLNPITRQLDSILAVTLSKRRERAWSLTLAVAATRINGCSDPSAEHGVLIWQPIVPRAGRYLRGTRCRTKLTAIGGAVIITFLLRHWLTDCYHHQAERIDVIGRIIPGKAVKVYPTFLSFWIPIQPPLGTWGVKG